MIDIMNMAKHQQEIIDFLRNRTHAMVQKRSDDGTDEAVLLSLPSAPACCVFIVSPLVKVDYWIRACKEFRPDFQILTFENQKQFRFPKLGEVVIVNPERNASTGQHGVGPNVDTIMIIDNADLLCSNDSMRQRKLRSISSKCAKVYALITSLPSDLEKLFNILDATNLLIKVFSDGCFVTDKLTALKIFKKITGRVWKSYGQYSGRGKWVYVNPNKAEITCRINVYMYPPIKG